MTRNQLERNDSKLTRKSTRTHQVALSAAVCAVEPLEGRQFFSVTGFSLVDQQAFPTAPTTVTNQPTIFQTTLQNTWKQLLNGSMKINGQTLQQEIASGIQKAEAEQSLSAYDISATFDSTPNYNGVLKTTSSGHVLELTFDAIGNTATFTSTTNSIFGSWADPTFHVSYNLNLTVDLSLPSNLAGGKVTATANATTSNVTVSTNNILVGLADIFGADIPQKIAQGINGQQQNLSSLVPTGMLNTALQLESAQGYTHLLTGLDSGGNLLLTALKPTLTVNGGNNDHITISTGSSNSVVISAGGKSQTFASGYLNTIIVNDSGYGTNAVNIPSLPSGVAVQIKDNSAATDNVTVGSSGSLASVAGTVSVSNSSSTTSLNVDDYNDIGASKLTVTNNAVAFNGHNVVTYSAGTNGGQTKLTVEAGKKDSVAVNSTSSATPVTIIGLGSPVTVGTGTLTAIAGPLDISTFGAVQINDWNDTANRKIALSSTTSGIFTSSTVVFQGLATIDLGYVTGVTIEDGTGNNAYTATGTPAKNFFTIEGHFGDSVSGPAAAEVDLNLFSRLLVPVKVLALK